MAAMVSGSQVPRRFQPEGCHFPLACPLPYTSVEGWEEGTLLPWASSWGTRPLDAHCCVLSMGDRGLQELEEEPGV